MNYNIIPFCCLPVDEGVWEGRKEWVFQYSWAGSLHRPKTRCQDSPAVRGQLVPMSRPGYYKRLLFPAAGRRQALPVWLRICSPPLSSTLEGCPAVLRMALAGPDSSLVLDIALFPSAAQAPCHTSCRQPSETTEDTFFNYSSSGPTPRYPLLARLLLDNW